MDNLIERLNKFKKEFVKTDLSKYENKLKMFDELCDLERDISVYFTHNKYIFDDLAKAARSTCEVDG